MSTVARYALVSLFLVSGVVSVRAEEAPPPPAPEKPAKTLAQLIEDLGNDSFKVREDASEALKATGAEALPALRKVLDSTQDMEIKVRAEEIIKHIERKIEEEKQAKRPKVKVGPLVSSTSTNVNGAGVTWGEDAEGNVLLRTTDRETGKEKEATATSWKDFVKRHPDLAREFKVTERGPRGGGIVQFGGVRIQVGQRVRVMPQPEKEAFVRWKAGGAAVEAVTEVLRYHLGLPEDSGVLVREVTAGGPAGKLGLKKHDILLAVDGTKITGPEGLRALGGEFTRLSVIQKGKRMTLERKPDKTEETAPPEGKEEEKTK
jgi:hypothetical protein